MAPAVLLEEKQLHLVLSTQLARIKPQSAHSLGSAAAGAAGETGGEQRCSRGEQGTLVTRPPEGVRGQVVGRGVVSRVWGSAEGPRSGASALDAHFTAFACLGVVISAFNRDSHCRDFLALIYFRPVAGLSFNPKFAGQRPPPFTSESRPCGSPGCWQRTSETLSRGHPPCTVSCACRRRQVSTERELPAGTSTATGPSASLKKGSRALGEERDAGTGTKCQNRRVRMRGRGSLGSGDTVRSYQEAGTWFKAPHQRLSGNAAVSASLRIMGRTLKRQALSPHVTEGAVHSCAPCPLAGLGSAPCGGLWALLGQPRTPPVAEWRPLGHRPASGPPGLKRLPCCSRYHLELALTCGWPLSYPQRD